MPEGALSLQEPPTLPEAQRNMSSVFTYLPMAMASVATMLIFVHPGTGGTAFTYLAAGMMMISSMAMLVGQVAKASGDRKRKLAGDRRDYLRYLTQNRGRIRKVVTEQRDAQSWRNPDPDTLWSLVRSSRLWERRATHDDFCEIRFAVGEQQLGMTLTPMETKPVEDLEPLCSHALRRFIKAYSTVSDQPTTLYLRGFAFAAFRGDPDAGRAMARAILGQLAVFHAPEELRLAFCLSDESRPYWEWAKWLPHAQHPTEADGAGQVRLVADDIFELERTLGEEFEERPRFDPQADPSHQEPYVVIVLDGGKVPTGSRLYGGGYRNAIVIDVTETLEWNVAPYVLALEVKADSVQTVGEDRSGRETLTPLGRPDRLSLARVTALARLLAPYRTHVTTEVTEPLTTDFDLTALLGIDDLHDHNVRSMWGDKLAAESLRVPIGMSATGQRVELDIKEAALGGMGPHGMLVGATGSGKSELLRTLILTLALEHSSEILNFVLVDFKGGATFLGLDKLPHTSAVITNLSDEVPLVARMQDALHGELIRRQELLRAAGNFASIHEYERARKAGVQLDPFPALFVIVDEFSELLSAHRDFMDLFVMIGRLGRSLGVHLLLASQRLDEGRVAALETHLSYRIGLRTFSAMESRTVLGVPDAHQLPSQPGNGLLKSDTATLTRFKAAYVSGPYRPRKKVAGSKKGTAEGVNPYTSRYVAPRVLPTASSPEEQQPEEATAESLLNVAAERLIGAGPPARQVWLPPLEVPPSLGELLPPLSVDPVRGFTAAGWPELGKLSVPVGLVDRPFDQRRDPLPADLSAGGGHVGIAGGPQSGKSTLLRTLICTLALTHTPAEVQFYCLDFGGGSLISLAGLPHMGGVTGRLDVERVNRTVGEVVSLLASRERMFAERGIDSMATLRRMRAAGELPDEPFGDVFLVIDGWVTMKQDFMDLSSEVVQLAGRGLNYGIHVMVASARWAEFPSALRDQIATRFELRLGDPVDSVINMRKAGTVPRIPGRGLTDEQLHFLTALPQVDPAGPAPDLARGVNALVERVASAWHGPKAPPVRMLPAVLPVADMPPAQDGPKIAIGWDERELAPVWHDFDATPHLLVVGDSESGKTNLVKVIIASVLERYSPDAARIMLVDFRRELYDAVPKESQLGYAVSVDVVRELVTAAKQAMDLRRPGADITPERLRKRDWWSGPQLFLVIDDYEMVHQGGMGGPLEPLLELLAQGAEVGMHLIVTRAANGIGRAMMDPVLRRLGELNTPTVLLSCPPAEGLVFGNIKPKALPPGRALLLSRRGNVQIQTARMEE